MADKTKGLDERFEKMEQILLDLEKEKQKQKMRGFVRLGVLLILLVYMMFGVGYVYQAYKYATSENFLDGLQYRAMQMAPQLSNQLGETLQKKAPEIYDSLKGKIDEFLPQLADKVTTDYIPRFIGALQEQSINFVDNTLAQAKEKINDFVYTEVNNVFAVIQGGTEGVGEALKGSAEGVGEAVKESIEGAGDELEGVSEGLQEDVNNLTTMEVGEIRTLSPEQFEELKMLVAKRIDERFNVLFSQEISGHLQRCVATSQQLMEKVEGFKGAELNSDERQELTLSILKSFIEAVAYFQGNK